MRINLIFQVYSKQHFSADDYFDNILSKIDKTYVHTIQDIRSIYVPINVSDIDEEKKRGRMVVYMGENATPNLLVKEMTVSFVGIDGDYEEVKEFLVDNYGENATKCEVVIEEYLNEGLEC